MHITLPSPCDERLGNYVSQFCLSLQRWLIHIQNQLMRETFCWKLGCCTRLTVKPHNSPATIAAWQLTSHGTSLCHSIIPPALWPYNPDHCRSMSTLHCQGQTVSWVRPLVHLVQHYVFWLSAIFTKISLVVLDGPGTANCSHSLEPTGVPPLGKSVPDNAI